MRTYFLIISVVLGIFLLLSPTMSSIYATHNSKDNKEARKEAGAVSEKNNAEETVKIDKVKETFKNFRDAFIVWKTIKETWKSIKNSGNEDSVLQTKKLLDESIVLKDKAWQEYVDARNTS